MSMSDAPFKSTERSERVLILAPLGREGASAAQALEAARIVVETCADMDALVDALPAGAGAVLLTQEALSSQSTCRLREALADQPPWSDLPILILLSGGAAAPPVPLFDPAINITPLEWPIAATSLASTVRSMLRARRRQYDLRDQLLALEQARAEQRRAIALSQATQKRLQILADVTAVFSESARNIPVLLGLLAHRVAISSGDGCALCLVQPAAQTLGLTAAYHSDPADLARVGQAIVDAPLRLPDGAAALAVDGCDRCGLAYIADLDAASFATALSRSVEATFSRTPAQSVLAVPVNSGNRTFGALVVWRSEPGQPYSEADYALFGEIAGRAGMAIDNARLFRNVQLQSETHAQLNAALREAAIQRDLALAEAQAERARLRELFRQMPAGVVATRGPEHTVDFANPLYTQLVSSEATAELAGRNLREALPNRCAQTLLDMVDKAYHAGERQVVAEAFLPLGHRADGRFDEAFFNFTAQPYRDAEGRVLGVIVHVAEVTLMVRARERLRQLQELTVRLGQSLDTELLFNHIVDAVAELLDVVIAGLYFLQEPGGDFVCVAARGLDLGGQGSRLPRYGSLAGRTVDEQRAAAADDVSQGQAAMLPRLIGGAPVGAVAVAPIFSGAEALGAIEVYSPVPRHWETEDLELLAAFAAAAGVAISNARLHQREREAIQVRDDFLAAASHDLKNPLTAVRGAAQMLERSLASTGSVPPNRLAVSVRTIDNASARMVNQIEELLDVARLRLGEHLPLERTSTDLVALARQLVEAHQATSESHPISVETDEPRLIGTWDRRRLGRAIDNLLSNAIKYSPAGGPITVSIAREQHFAVLSVRDRGLGIPEADLPHVFERFRRAANVLGRVEGTGIGLAAAAQIVAQHAGSIDLQSQVDVGTTVTIRLPLELHT